MSQLRHEQVSLHGIYWDLTHVFAETLAFSSYGWLTVMHMAVSALQPSCGHAQLFNQLTHGTEGYLKPGIIIDRLI